MLSRFRKAWPWTISRDAQLTEVLSFHLNETITIKYKSGRIEESERGDSVNRKMATPRVSSAENASRPRNKVTAVESEWGCVWVRHTGCGQENNRIIWREHKRLKIIGKLSTEYVVQQLTNWENDYVWWTWKDKTAMTALCLKLRY